MGNDWETFARKAAFALGLYETLLRPLHDVFCCDEDAVADVEGRTDMLVAGIIHGYHRHDSIAERFVSRPWRPGLVAAAKFTRARGFDLCHIRRQSRARCLS